MREVVLGLCGVGLGVGFWGFADGPRQDRVGSSVGASGFWAWRVVLGHLGLGLGVGGVFWDWEVWFWACAAVMLDVGVMVLGNVVLGVWGGTRGVRGLVGWFLGSGEL